MRNPVSVIGMDFAPKDQKILLNNDIHLDRDIEIVSRLWLKLQNQDDLEIPGIKDQDDLLVGMFWRRRNLKGIIPTDIGKLIHLNWLYFFIF
jgi:hypothetical protein